MNMNLRKTRAVKEGVTVHCEGAAGEYERNLRKLTVRTTWFRQRNRKEVDREWKEHEPGRGRRQSRQAPSLTTTHACSSPETLYGS